MNSRVSRNPFGPFQMSHRARRVLAEIRAHPSAFDVASWLRPPVHSAGEVQAQKDLNGIAFLLPDQDPVTCGTTLCVAGWAAHLDGWTVDSNGTAFKGRCKSSVALVGATYLGIADTAYWSLFNQARNEDAITILEFMANNNRFPNAHDIFVLWEGPIRGGE